MTALACHYGEDVTSTALASSVKAEPSFVRKMVSKLAKAGLVKATRGKGGACTIARLPEQITLLDIYQAAKAPAAFSIHAYPVENACAVSCRIKELMENVLQDAQQEFEKCLGRHRLSELVLGVKEAA